MRNVCLKSRNSWSAGILLLLLTSPGCFNATITWTSTALNLAFLGPLNSPLTITSNGQINSISVGVENGSGTIVTSGGPYTVSLAIFQDSKCTIPYAPNGGSNAIGVPTPTQGGIALISTQGGSQSPQGTIYIQASSPGLSSICSSSVTFSGGINLVSQIEMLDLGAASLTGAAVPLARSQTTLDTSAYDGASYYFEVLALNSDSSLSHNVSLMNSGSSIATVNVPANTTQLTRLARAPFSPVSGNGTYQVQLDTTSTAGFLEVSAARIIVQQNGATKTKLYIPLIQGNYNTYSPVDSGPSGAAISTTSSTLSPESGQYPKNQTIWNKTNGAYSNLNSGSPWSLEVVMAASNSGYPANVALVNSSGVVVSGSTLTTTQLTPTLQVTSFADFASGDTYGLTAYTTSPSNVAYIYRAGLWVSLSGGIQFAEIYNRIFSALSNLSSTYTSDWMRNYLDMSLYSNPSVYFETVSNITGGGTVSMQDCGVSDTGTAGCSNVFGSTFAISGTSSPSRLRSPTSLPITNGDRYIFTTTVGTGSTQQAGSFVVIQIHP